MWRCNALPAAVPAICASSAAVILTLIGCSTGTALTVMPSKLPGRISVDPEAAARGEQVYQRNCESCHGVRGDGMGMSASSLVPRPRNFVAAVYKCRSTPSGSLPLPTDLRDTAERGLHATAMPGWGVLGDGQLDDVIAFVVSLSPRWQKESVEPVLAIPPEPPDSPEARASGRALYEKMQCFQCHGPRGEGNGPAVPTLHDEAGNPIVPFDFTGRSPLRCGSSPREMYRTFMTGLDGTPMPSFAAQLSPEEGWSLVHYLMGLRK